MDYKKVKTEPTAVTRKIRDFDMDTSNIYESVAIISKRANQISIEMKEELDQKIQEFYYHRIIWKRSSKTGSKLRLQGSMSVSQSNPYRCSGVRQQEDLLPEPDEKGE